MKKEILKFTAAAIAASALLSGCSDTKNEDNVKDELKEITVQGEISSENETPVLSSDFVGGTLTAISDDEGAQIDALFKQLSSSVPTKIEEREWAKYSCPAAKDKLTGAEASFYGRLNEICGGYLKNSMYEAADFSGEKVLKGAKYSDLGLSADEAANVCFWFRLNNPQYFFLDNSVLYSTTCVYFCLGDYLAQESDPAKAANELFTKLDGWIKECESEESAADKMLAANRLICASTARSDNPELGDKQRSMYSVLRDESGVCTGYAEALCAVANGLGVKTYTAQSENYVWNVFESDDKNFYYADACLNDSENAYSESFIGAGTEYALSFDNRGNAHVYSDRFSEWLPTASQESLSLSSAEVSAPAPRISGSGGPTVKLEWDGVENASGYEYLIYNGTNIVSSGISAQPCVFVSISSGTNKTDVKIRTLKTESGKTESSDWASITVLHDSSTGRPATPADVKAEIQTEGLSVTWSKDDSADDCIFFRMDNTLTEILGYDYTDGKNGVSIKNADTENGCFFKVVRVKKSGNVEIYSDPVMYQFSAANGLKSISGIDTGKNIVKNYSDGVYVGDLTDGQRNGFGTMTYTSGDIYSGEWKNDVQNGTGKITRADGVVYEGEFSDGKISGNGKMTTKYANGDTSVIEGSFENSRAGGQVKMKYSFADGTSFVYEGEYQNDNINGAGTKTTSFKDGSVTTETGTFANGNLSGAGSKTVKYGSGNVYLYEGEFTNGIFTCTGKRTIKYKSGDKSVIEGDFTDSDISGQVKMTYTFARGTEFTYEGEYSNSAMNGEGVKTTHRTDKSYIVEEGTFRKDKLYNGTYTLYNSDGSVRTKRQYVNGTAR